jgi:rhodanese-related sulfurtransferase
MIQHIAAQQLKDWMNKGEAVLIDVREPAEYAAEHIPDAISLPLGKIVLDKLPEHAGKKLVFQCHSGKRGSEACKEIMNLDSSRDVYNLVGGIMAWTQAGYGVFQSGKSFLPLDRQVQVTIGFFLLLGSILAYAVHPAFLLLTGFFGVGLMFAGLTGFCGLARLLALMPWNRACASKAPPSACGI